MAKITQSSRWGTGEISTQGPKLFATKALRLVAKKPIIDRPWKMMWFVTRLSPSLGL
jgi:hypothetical protein